MADTTTNLGLFYLSVGGSATAVMNDNMDLLDTAVGGGIIAGATISAKNACRVASTALLTVTYANGSSGVGATLTNAGAQAALSLDGVSLAAGDRVLVKDQSSQFQNGIYSVTTIGSGATNWVLTRSTDCDEASDMARGMFTVVDHGSAYACTLWVQTATGSFVVGTSVLVWEQATIAPASNTLAGKVELATTAETSAGTDSGRAVSPAALAGSIFGTFIVSVMVTDPNGSVATTGDGKAYWFVPFELDGCDLVSVSMGVTTVSSSGIPTVQINNQSQTADMLSTKLTVDASETHSKTAATAATIDTGNDDVAYGDMIRFDIDVAGTGTKGICVTMGFRKP